MQRNVG
jgi:regulator of replication initiation timing